VVHGGGEAPAAAAVHLAIVSVGLLSLRQFLVPAALWLGTAHGLVARWAARTSCGGRLPQAELTIEVRVLEPALGGIGTAEPLVGCTGGVTVRWPNGQRVAAGDRVRVTGRWAPKPAIARADGLLIAREIAVRSSQPRWFDRLRNWIWSTDQRLYGTRAGLIDALVVGRRGGIDPTVNAAFARSGLVHLLSISGFHVGLIAGWLLMLFRAARQRREVALLGSSLIAAVYVVFIGMQAPAARAAFLCVLAAVQVTRQRQVQSNALLATTALLVLLGDPWAVLDIGGWLSVAALWGAMTFSRWSDRALGSRAVWRLLSGSVGATAATAPFSALMFGAIAPVGIVLNLVAIPLAAVAVPGVLASLLMEPIWPAAAEAFARGSGILLSLLEQVARFGAAVPGGNWSLEPGWPSAVLAAGGLALLLAVVGGRATGREAGRRLTWVAAILLGSTAVFDAGPAPDSGSSLTLHFLNVGQGDAAVLRTPHGRWVLIDAGPASDREDAGRRVVLPFLVRQGVHSLAAAVISHPHLDHFGGLASVVAEIPTRVVAESGEPANDPRYLELLDRLDELGIPWRRLTAGEQFAIDGVEFAVLHPDTTWAGWGTDLNEGSVVLRVRQGEFEALFTGDIGVPVEGLLRGRIGPVDLLKVGHHGSAGSSTAAFLAELDPRAAVVSTGPNRYGHPSPEALARLAEEGTDIWRTDRDGTVTVTVGDSTMRIEGRGREREYPLRRGSP
jgi:competence protein ComEC